MDPNGKKLVLEGFAQAFGDTEGVRCFFAPGRVNLIGEHTDYNGGHVFPCALDIGCFAAVRKREDRVMRFYSVNFPQAGTVTTSLDALVPQSRSGWTNYPAGVVWAFGTHGCEPDVGFDMAIYGDIPNGSGLSSSAALEVVTGTALRALYGWDKVTNVDIALLGQLAENEYNGMKCGIMDQFASAMGKAGNAIFLDTNTMEYAYAPVQLEGMKLMIVNTNRKHSLVDSEYNLRREQCAAALADLQKELPVKTLGDLTEEEFEAHKDLITDPVCLRRARHAVYENRRTIEAVAALQRGDIEEFGRLMNASHVSLRDDYETSCPEADILTEEAWKIPGVLGSRITGGGFGGCTVSIVKDEAVDTFVETLDRVYREKVGYPATFYRLGIGDGPAEI
ncbi:MAG: galactokinase [Lachnospiraceae bacterium]|nr:galactokinase [Lachnospiraceae bacterium]